MNYLSMPSYCQCTYVTPADPFCFLPYFIKQRPMHGTKDEPIVISDGNDSGNDSDDPLDAYPSPRPGFTRTTLPEGSIDVSAASLAERTPTSKPSGSDAPSATVLPFIPQLSEAEALLVGPASRLGIKRFAIDGQVLYFLKSRLIATRTPYDDLKEKKVDNDPPYMLPGPETRERAWRLPSDDGVSALASSQVPLVAAQYLTTSQDCQDVITMEGDYRSPSHYEQQPSCPGIAPPSVASRCSGTTYTALLSSRKDVSSSQPKAPTTHLQLLRGVTEASQQGRRPSNHLLASTKLVSSAEVPWLQDPIAGAPNGARYWKVSMLKYGIDWVVTTSSAGNGTDFQVAMKYSSDTNWNIESVILPPGCTKRQEVSSRLPRAEDARFWPTTEFTFKKSQNTMRGNLVDMIETLRHRFGHSPLGK
jgi:hypothetical protein